MLRFSLKQLLMSTTLIAVGVAYIAYTTLHGDKPHPLGIVGALSMWTGSGACVGGGLFNLFGKPLIGATIGGAAALSFLGYIWWTIST